MFVRLVFPLLCVVGVSAQCPAGNDDRRLTGSWGGDGIGLIVAAEKATVSYTCGRTTIDGRIALDGDQRFEATGEHERVGGAPPREGVPPERQRSHVSGRIRSGVMTMTVRLTDLNQTVGTFALTRGTAASILPCP